MTKQEILEALKDCTYLEIEEIAAAAQSRIDEEKALVLARAQQMGLLKPRKPRNSAVKHPE